jgi:hypothetical protein
MKRRGKYDQKSNKSEVRSIKVGWVAPEGVDDLEEV